MSNDSLVSVIIPAYNAEKYIREALCSVLGQTYEHLEVIVVDDGSRDRTGEIVREVAREDERVTLLQQPNEGVAAARNRGIRVARGEFIAPLDADDTWVPRKIEAQLERIEACGNSVGMVYAWTVDVDEDGAIQGAPPPEILEGDILWPLLVVNVIGCASVPLIRRSALQEVGYYDERLRAHGQGCEDWDLYLRIAERFDIGVTPEYLIRYYRAASTMSRNGAGMAGSYEAVISALQVRQPDLPDKLFGWSAGNFYAYLANMSYTDWKFGQTLRWLGRSVRADPVQLLSRGMWRMGVRSGVALIAAPLLQRVWPSREAWVRDKVRFGGAPPPRYTLEEVLNAAQAPSHDRKRRSVFQRIQARRWAQLMGRVQPIQCDAGAWHGSAERPGSASRPGFRTRSIRGD